MIVFSLLLCSKRYEVTHLKWGVVAGEAESRWVAGAKGAKRTSLDGFTGIADFVIEEASRLDHASSLAGRVACLIDENLELSRDIDLDID